MELTPIIERLIELQSGGTIHCPPGLFPSWRSNPRIGYRRPDTNLFFSAISAFTLQSLKSQLPSAELKEKTEQILKGIRAHYPAFQNKDGLKTYNFWKTRPSDHFSNGFIFRHFEHFRIPDDLDDTAMVYLTTRPSAEELLWLKQKLARHANGSSKWAKNTYPEYRSLTAYSTWFGKNMYIEMDACVLSNMLYCLYHYKLPFNQHDQDSLNYIRSVVESGRYKTEAFRCAHQYPRTALIIYHIARLISAFEPLYLKKIKPELIAAAYELLDANPHILDRVILSTSLLRLGETPPRVPVQTLGPADFRGFWFFIAGLLTAYENPLLYRFAKSGLFHMYWECEAHCWVLIAEYMLLTQKTSHLQRLPSQPAADV